MAQDKEKPPALLKSLTVNYNDKDLRPSSNPLGDGKERSINSSRTKTPDNLHRVWRDCEYK
jgi:hypothetical protein